MDYPTPNQLIAEIHAATNLTQDALGKRIGISQPVVSRLLSNAQAGCTLKVLYALLRTHAEVTKPRRRRT